VKRALALLAFRKNILAIGLSNITYLRARDVNKILFCGNILEAQELNPSIDKNLSLCDINR
jgi:hypothetical protein